MTNPRLQTFRIALRRMMATGLALLVLAVPASAQDDPEDIDDARDQREEARDEQARTAALVELEEAELDEIEAALADITAAAEFQQSKVDAARADLSAAQNQLAQAQDNIARTNELIASAEAEVKRFAVEAYVGSGSGETEDWLESSDVAETARRESMLGYVNGDQADVFEQLRQLQADQAEAVESAAAAEAEQRNIEAKLAVDLALLEDRRELQDAIKAEVESRITGLEAQLRELEAEEDELTTFIQEQIAATSAADPGVVSSSGWTWPTSGGIGSGFGPRFHPILRINRLHAGLDIGGAHGNAIWAAADGTVISAGWSGGYGNRVVINHGGGITTVYAHMSSIAISNGARVEAGDVIGAVGSTGLSTGPHLHFEVRSNGVPVDPRPYLP
ncbi:MAG: peptidoglycan DD-metalloendopeptidase family protein [Acidimicrobiales bacterium]|nr:peptidoglycan DD-metalloendopeptidase family protein [Acidimicrobiales bacterium]